MAPELPRQEAPRHKIVADQGSEVSIAPGGAKGAISPDADRVAVPTEAAVLPVRNIVLFPGAVFPLNVGREKSRKLIDSVLPAEKVIVTVCQKHPEVNDPAPEDLYSIGTAAIILKLLRTEEGSQIIVQGLTRVRIEEYISREPYLLAKITVLTDEAKVSMETEALMMNARNIARRIVHLSPNIPEEAAMVLDSIDAPGTLTDFLAFNLQMDTSAKQKLLEELDVGRRLRQVILDLQHQLEVLELSNKIQSQVKANIDHSQREYFLQEQLKAIQKELGQMDEKSVEVAQVRQKLDASGMPDPVRKEALRELSRMENIPTVSPEYGVIRTYLDWMCELPWSVSTQDKIDVNRAKNILDADHYNLEKVKRRILEYLAVRKLAPSSRGPILCFVGPPGVGKTSLGQSIARALGRKFIRMSLGGIRDEAELRGHRRTYIGAMPGRVVQEIRKAGTNNPVFMLDELDKVGADFRGDPTAALLEVLDPAQNFSFQDHYLNIPFDLSKVLFIGTANIMGMVSPALRDRLEVIELPGYTQQDKLQIALKYLIPRQLDENGLKATQVKWTRQAVVKIIDSYTREAGVRELERQIGTICRGVAALIAAGKARCRTISPAMVVKLLGSRKYESELALRTSSPGVATGLAYTAAGGEIMFVEATAYPGKGGMILTGQIGDVMRESAQAAMSLLKSRADAMGIRPDSFSKVDVHVHVPAGAIPKDGPSAGVAMFTALASLAIGRSVRPDVAMTGEVTLRGLVLPVGGVKEKVLAAKRAGIRTVVLPERNRKDILEIPAEARKGLNFAYVRNVDDAMAVALVKAPKARDRSVKAPPRSTKPRHLGG